MSFDGEMPNELVRAVIDGRSLALVGAGLSRPVVRSNGRSLPDWRGLLREVLEIALADNIPLSGLDGDLSRAIEDGQLTLAAQELHDRLGSNAVTRILRNVFLDPAVKPTATHSRLVRIPFRGVLTTNYDTLIEGAAAVETGGRIPPVLTQEDLEEVQNPLRANGPFVFKMHGDINRPGTIVLGSHDYQEALFRRPGYRSFLETSFTINTVLFLGFGLADPDVDNMLDRLAAVFARNNEFHFALVPKGRFSLLEQRRLALDKRIRVIEYENRSGDHTDVYRFLDFLYELTAPGGKLRDEYRAKSASTHPEPSPEGRGASLMISYAGEDREFVERLAHDLQANGIRVWIDASMIQVGDSIVSKVNEAIASMDFVLVALSRAFFAKRWPKRELDAALFRESQAQRALVIPAVLDISSDEVRELSPLLGDRRYLDFGHSYEAALAELLRLLQRSRNDRAEAR